MARIIKRHNNGFALHLCSNNYFHGQKEWGSIKADLRINQSFANRSSALPSPGLKQELQKPRSSTTAFTTLPSALHTMFHEVSREHKDLETS